MGEGRFCEAGSPGTASCCCWDGARGCGGCGGSYGLRGPTPPPLRVTVRAGEVLYLPALWWHQVGNWHTQAVPETCMDCSPSLRLLCWLPGWGRRGWRLEMSCLRRLGSRMLPAAD